ncbi:MAG: hypothetical protein U0271_48185 [Polyangiaceae bacterium]
MTPDVERLSSRLAETPAIFLGGLRSAPDAIELDAVVADLFRARAERALTSGELAELVTELGLAKDDRASLRHQSLVAVTTFLLFDPAFQGAPITKLRALMIERLRALAGLVMPRAFVEDSERREELVRTCIAEVGLLPAGESREIADDRLATLDSVRRAELVREARERENAREARRKELERLRAEEEEARRQAARTTFED